MKRAILLALVVGACWHQAGPTVSPVDEPQYRAQHAAWLEDRQATAVEAARLVGLWTLSEGDTPFGADPALAISLPKPAGPGRIGLIRRAGDAIAIVPAPHVALTWADGSRVGRAAPFERDLAFGTLRLHLESMREADGNRRFVTAWDEASPPADHVAAVDVYPIGMRWRVPAKFEAFSSPGTRRLATVQGGTVDMTAPGQLVFRVGGREQRLTALKEAFGDQFLVMFRDETNQSTTYAGYRQLYCAAVGHGEWTVLDFNLASNPPCAYSPYTLCSLPPPENRLAIAVEAGERRYPGN